MTTSHLRPDPEVLGREWREIVEAEYEQVERLREWHNTDTYQSITSRFIDDPYRSDDQVLDALRELGHPEAIWLDIGAGAGRYSLPLALSSKQVIAVDPSSSMSEALKGELERHGIQNVVQRDLRWPEGSHEIQADFSLASHVGYDIREINSFIDGLEHATRERCVVLLMDSAPSGGFERLWEQVHNEPRQRLPALRDFAHLLLARGSNPEIRNFPRDHQHGSGDEIRTSARRRLWLSERSAKDQRLQSILDEEIANGAADFQVPLLIGMVSWEP